MNFRVVRLAAVVCLVVISGRAFANGGAVVVQDVPGYNSWPMIQSVRDDGLVCVYSRGKVHEIDEGGRGAYARVSSDGGRTWSAEVCVANDPIACEVPIGKGRSPDGGAYFWIRCYGGTNPHHDLYKTKDGISFERMATPSFSSLPMQITDIFSVGSELMALSFAEGLEAYFTYCLRAYERDRFYSEDHFGIIHANLVPKPAWLAVKNFALMRPPGSVNHPGDWWSDSLCRTEWRRPDGVDAGMVWYPRSPTETVLVFPKNAKLRFHDMWGKPAVVRSLGDGRYSLKVGDEPVYYAGARMCNVRACGGQQASFSQESTQKRQLQNLA